MDPSIPSDVVDDIIDQVADGPRSLRQLALTCAQFLPRSRYHLLARHVCLRDKPQIDEFCAYLHTNPDKRSVIRAVKLLIPYVLSAKEAPETQGLLDTLTSLLPLRNLQYLGIQPCCSVTSRLLSFGPDQLACLEMCTTSITTLDMLSIKFRNVKEFTRFLFAFPALHSLRCSYVHLQKNAMEMTLGSARERLGKQLNLTSLHLGSQVDQSVMVLLLELGQSTIEELTFHAIKDVVNREQIHDLVCGVTALHSITMKLSHYYDYDDFQQVLVDAWELIMKLPTSPARTHTISVYSLGHLDFVLAKEPFIEKSQQLEQVLLNKTSYSILFTALGTKRHRKTFWMTTLGRHFPELYERGRLTIECDDSSDANDMTGHDSRVDSLAASPDCKWIASGSLDRTIILWDAQRSAIVQEWVAHKGSINCLAFSPDSRLLASGGDDYSLVIWDVNEGCNRVATLNGHTHRVAVCAWSPDGRLLASRDLDGGVHVWDPRSFTQLHSFDSTLDGPRYVRFSPDGRWLAFPGETKGCTIWDTTNRCFYKTLDADMPFFRHAAFDHTSRRIVLVHDDRTIKLWSIVTEEELLTLRRGYSSITDIAFSPNGDWVLSTSKDGTAEICDSHTGEQILPFKGHTNTIYSACFSPDGKYVASASVDRTVRLWSTRDGSCVGTFTEHTDRVRHVLFSPDGQTLCSGADDGTVVIRQLRDIIP